MEVKKMPSSVQKQSRTLKLSRQLAKRYGETNRILDLVLPDSLENTNQQAAVFGAFNALMSDLNADK